MPNSAPTYYPPIENAPAQLIVDAAAVWLQRCWARVGSFELAGEDAQRLREACRGPAIVCPNHPSLNEPVIVHRVLRQVGVRPVYLMAWHTMRVMSPWLRWLARGAGAYSVRRSAPDRASLQQTRACLRDGRALVMFPEGETYGINDRLLPFHGGVAQMGLWGLQDRIKAGREAGLSLIPVVVKYLYLQPMEEIIEESLTQVEERLGIEPPDGSSRYQRVRAAGFVCIRVLSSEYGAATPDDLSLDESIEWAFRLLLQRVAAGAGIELSEDATIQDKLRRLFASIHEELYHSEAASEYEREVQQQRAPAWRAFERDLARLQTFQAVGDGYIAEYPSAERYLDVLGRLEREILDKGRVFGPRRAIVRVGEPVQLADYLERYDDDRRATVATVTSDLRDRSLGLVEELTRAAPLIEDPRTLQTG